MVFALRGATRRIFCGPERISAINALSDRSGDFTHNYCGEAGWADVVSSFILAILWPIFIDTTHGNTARILEKMLAIPAALAATEAGHRNLWHHTLKTHCFTAFGTRYIFCRIGAHW